MNKNFGRNVLGLLLLVMISASSASAQGYDTTKWRFSNPKPIGFTTFDVDFFDNNNVLAVGSDGAIARSGNGGKSWTYGSFTYALPNGMVTKSIMYDVHFVTANIAYAVGTNGCMAKSNDGGKSWNFVNTPLYANSKSINTVWFVNKDTGYIGGQWNTLDSIPKVYFTKNGGSTWDSLVSPVGGKTRVGYINNVNLAPLVWDVTGKGKEIHRIEFTSANLGYIIGGGQSHFPPIPAASATSPCAATGGTTTTSANNAALVWKFSNGNLFDYSLSKERLGYSGINTNTVLCNTQYNSAGVTPVGQTYKAMNIINDSMIVIMSFNNNTVIRIRTGVSDNTVNMINSLPEPGRYEILNFPFPPTGGPQAGTPIPATQVLLASNPYQIRRTAAGKLCATAGNGLMWTSIDTGKNWVREWSLPQGQNYSSFSTPAMDISPNGRLLSMGAYGVYADSIAGNTSWVTTYVLVNAGASSKVEFADCLNGISAGSSVITVTSDGGNTWVDRSRPDFAASFYSINGMSYPFTNKIYFAVSNGTLYKSVDGATTLDPVFSDFNYGMNDIAAVGQDTVYAIGYSQTTVPAASRKSSLFRSFNNGATWQTIDIATTTTTPAFTAPTLRQMSFPSKNVGYVAGTRNAIYKTTDGGTNWTDISPFPSLNFAPPGFGSAFVTYTEIFALDDNTVFAVGNMFTSVNNRRIYRSTDGGTTWVNISGNIDALSSGNINGILFHDINNGYVILPGGVLLKTTNGGTTWTLDIAPTATIYTSLAFAPKRVPAGITFANRKVFVAGDAVGGQAAIMEYGATTDVNVNSAETKVAATCTNTTAGSITINATGGLAPYTYSINGGPYQASNTFSGLTQGPKTITIKDAFCGVLTKTVNVDFTDNLTLTSTPALDTTVCAGAPVPLVATSAATTYAWTPAAGLSNAGVSNPTATVNGNTTYTVTASLNGCVRTKSVQINIKPNPVISAGQDKTIVEGDITMLQGTANSPATIAWTPAATLTGAATLSPMAKPLTTTNYTLTVKDVNGCTSTDDVLITVIPYCLKPMEAFTPNGDGQNDRWMASTAAPCTSNIGVTVVNRYGNVVFKDDRYQNNWDGTYNGKPVPDGTYYFIIHYQMVNGTSLTLRGNLTIIR